MRKKLLAALTWVTLCLAFAANFVLEKTVARILGLPFLFILNSLS